MNRNTHTQRQVTGLITRSYKFSYDCGVSPQNPFQGLYLCPHRSSQVVDVRSFYVGDDIEHSRY